MTELYRYAAFISYSSKDAKFAQRLHRALESYGIPSSLGKFDIIGGGKANRIYPVFRDREELSAGHLGDQIEANLKASSSLIVVCSPNGAASPWVQKEIEFFVDLGRRARVFAVIADDAPVTDEAGGDATVLSFPPAFRGDALAEAQSLEPIAADARPGKDGFRNAWLKIVAGLIGVSPGQLIDRDKRRQRRRAMTIGVASVLVFLLTTYAIVNVRLVLQARDALQQAQNRPSRLQGALLAINSLPPPGTAFPLGWPEQEARELMARGGLDAVTDIRIDPHGAPTALAVQADGLLVGYGDGAVQWRSRERRALVWRGSSRIVAVDADRNLLAAVTSTGELVFADLDASEVVTNQVPGDPRAMVVDGRGRRLFIGLADRRIMEWSPTSSWREVGYHAQPVTALDLVNNSLTSGASDGSVVQWFPVPGSDGHDVIVAPLPATEYRSGVNAIAVSPNERWLAIGRRNGALEVIDLDTTSRQRRAVSQRRAMLLSLAFSPDSEVLAAAYDDGVIEIWPRQQTTPQVIYAHDGAISAVRFMGDGVLTSSGFDNTVRFWRPSLAGDPGSARSRACALFSQGDPATSAFDALLTGVRGASIRADVERACARRGMLMGPQ